MEIINFNNIKDIQEISAPGFFKQREKMNPEAFVYLTQIALKEFYTSYSKEVKTYKGYVLIGIDGSDFEVPNTRKARQEYNGKSQEQCARVTVSTCYDLLNHYTLDTIVEVYNYSETQMAKKHDETIRRENILGKFKSIRIMDRNYKNLSHLYQSIKRGDKFLLRIGASVYEKENQAMKTDDEEIEIAYEYNRIRYYKDTDPELYEYFMSGKKLRVRCVKVALETGEIEVLLTNLETEEFSKEEIKELYNKRWNIEINYKHLKNNLKIEAITSSKKVLIEQDIYSQVLVSNMMQAFINENEEKIEQEKYKNKMKINENMATGLFKNSLIYILLEKNGQKRGEMMEQLSNAMERYIVPVKPNRKEHRKNNPKNRYHINRRKTF